MKIKNNSIIHNLLKILFIFNFIILLGTPKFNLISFLIYFINLIIFWFNCTLLTYYIKY